MKKLIAKTITCALILSAQSAHSFDTSLKGFIALDALNFEKIQGKKGASVIGIGVLDLKVFANKDDLSAAIKLDLDGKLDKENNIFEEAYVTYRGIPEWRLLLGKGVVRFQNLHWGAVVNSYQDGGTVIGTENGYRKISRKAFIAAAYGDRKIGFQNQFTVWGESNEINQEDDGTPQYTFANSNGSQKISGYKTRDVTAFNTSKQIGVANKFDYYFSDALKMNLSGIYYKNRLQTKPSYGFDIGLNYETAEVEVWMDLLYGVTAKLPYESYTTYNKKDYFLQLGMEYSLNEKWSLVENAEILYVKDQQHVYDSTAASSFTSKSGNYYESLTYKLESAVKYKLTKSSHLTLGALFEKKKAKQNGVENLTDMRDVRNPNKEAYKLLSAVSFWF